jgi:hypothetical protein
VGRAGRFGVLDPELVTLVNCKVAT